MCLLQTTPKPKETSTDDRHCLSYNVTSKGFSNIFFFSSPDNGNDSDNAPQSITIMVTGHRKAFATYAMFEDEKNYLSESLPT